VAIGTTSKDASDPNAFISAACRYLLLFPSIDRPPGPSSMCTPSGWWRA
jgi:hypothetical protein